MGLRTTCPDQMHLRLFFHEPGCTPEADSVRAHLEQCEVCRAIVARLEAGDKNQNTLVDEGAVPARRVVEAGNKIENTVAYEAPDPALQVIPRRGTLEVFRVSTGDTAKSANDARVRLPVGEAEDGETLHLSDSLQVAKREGKNDPTETCCFLSGDDSSQIGAPDELCYILSGDDSSQAGVSDATRYTLPGDGSSQTGVSDANARTLCQGTAPVRSVHPTRRATFCRGTTPVRSVHRTRRRRPPGATTRID